jgi:hypothetical protein
MASTGLTQKQRLAHWEASTREVLGTRRRGTRYGETSTERQAAHGFKFEKATDDGKAQPGASAEGKARPEAREERGPKAGGS